MMRKTSRERCWFFTERMTPTVPPAQVAAFQEEMRKGGVDWQMIFYADAVHSFTNPSAGHGQING